jgi:hypothetical protein
VESSFDIFVFIHVPGILLFIYILFDILSFIKTKWLLLVSDILVIETTLILIILTDWQLYTHYCSQCICAVIMWLYVSEWIL